MDAPVIVPRQESFLSGATKKGVMRQSNGARPEVMAQEFLPAPKSNTTTTDA